MPFPRKISSRFAGVFAAALFVALLALFIVAPGSISASAADNWQGSYWNNRDLQGQPALMRWDAAIDFDWHGLSPDPSINVDNFSARWVRSLNFAAGTYTFRATMDDGMRVWVDGRLIIDSWMESNVRTIESAVWLNSGSHRIVVEYFEAGGNAVAGFTWTPNNQVVPPQPPPPTVQPPTVLPPGVIAPVAEVKAPFLNVRSAPGASQPVVAVLRQNTLVRMQARSSGGGWILINTDGVQGWVNKNFLYTEFPFTSLPTQGTNPVPPPVQPLPPAQGNTGVVNSSMLNVRSGPGVAFPVIAVLRGGTQVTIIETDWATGWLRVGIAGAGQGWVNGRYITR
jgi:uncharacterized protein YraI